MIFAIGGLLGAVISGKLLESIGRRWTIVLIDLLAICVICCYTLKSIPVLYVIRLFSGIVAGCGALCSAVVMKELLPKTISPMGNSLSASMITTFVFVGYIQ